MATAIFYFAIAPMALAYCVWVAAETVRECREIDRRLVKRSTRLLSISGAIEVR